MRETSWKGGCAWPLRRMETSPPQETFGFEAPAFYGLVQASGVAQRTNCSITELHTLGLTATRRLTLDGGELVGAGAGCEADVGAIDPSHRRYGGVARVGDVQAACSRPTKGGKPGRAHTAGSVFVVRPGNAWPPATQTVPQ